MYTIFKIEFFTERQYFYIIIRVEKSSIIFKKIYYINIISSLLFLI